MRFIANKLGRLLALGRIFITQMLKSSLISSFSDCSKVSMLIPVFTIVGERSTAKNYRPVSLLSVVKKVFEKLVNNRIVGHLGKYGLLSDLLCGFRSSQSTADLVTFASDRVARTFKKSGTN